MSVIRLTGRRSLCRACGLQFKSTHSFDQHRAGTFQPLARRCLTEAELRLIGLSPTTAGVWRVPMTETQRKRRVPLGPQLWATPTPFTGARPADV